MLRRLRKHTAEILMGAGALIWLVGELAAVLGGRAFGEPTTWYVRRFQKRFIVFHIVMVAFLVWLGLHFEAGLP